MSKTRGFKVADTNVLRLGPGLHAVESHGTVAVRNADQQVLARITVTSGSLSPLSEQLPPERLQRTSYLADLDCTDAALLPTVLYLAVRRARINGSSTIATHLDLDPLGLVSVAGGGARAQRVDLAAHRASAAVEMAPEVYAAEVLETFELWLRDLYGRGFFAAVWEQTLSREQYVYTLGNMHQFVRWTTRLLGHAVAHAHDRSLRDHFLAHLQGEINHEVIIERDLAHLGEDVRFVIDDMAASASTRHFMAVQESLVGLHHDLVLFLASPLAAEGVASHLTPEFLHAMEHNIAAWGVAEPRSAMAFFRSHVNTDGGDDGHWELVLRMVASHLRSERQLAAFLGILRASTGALTAAYDAFVDDLALFAR